MVELGGIRSRNDLVQYIREKDTKKKDGRVSVSEDPSVKKYSGFDKDKNGLDEKELTRALDLFKICPNSYSSQAFKGNLLGIISSLSLIGTQIDALLHSSNYIDQDKYTLLTLQRIKLFVDCSTELEMAESVLGEQETKNLLSSFVKENPKLNQYVFELATSPEIAQGLLEQVFYFGALGANLGGSEEDRNKFLLLLSDLLAEISPNYSGKELHQKITESIKWLENKTNQAKIAEFFHKKTSPDLFWETEGSDKLLCARHFFPKSIFDAQIEEKLHAVKKYSPILLGGSLNPYSPAERKTMADNFLVAYNCLANKMPYGNGRIGRDGSLVNNDREKNKPGLSCIALVETLVKMLFGNPEINTNIKTGFNLIFESELKDRPKLTNLTVEMSDPKHNKIKDLLGKLGTYFVVQSYMPNGEYLSPAHAVLVFKNKGQWFVFEAAVAGQTAKVRKLDWWLGTHSYQSLTFIPLDCTLKNNEKKIIPVPMQNNNSFIENLLKAGVQAIKTHPYKKNILEFLKRHSAKV
ncbi:hypothetical protein A2276_06600 [candidate division WOR-1 bacterium RIFOXYA12_FULL_43_27]|uniref:Uncharacterized protein n=1 Tax=candidate division WOR-1 bacterium RIFOXYC2_FULL_46_14 TaxID=1802587 RepID=A0A1F4U5F5_UNCSA|nr:MAG: hypothetical protein A2276_06600 [candidate division WOR-1 bacterium RIFOXYA12_FULL_43_27]OGC20316.1 MAG: hypothetical protein A2292_04600 [candidate division WOR-1 bacterium RIFOXYB2_FULL_46_45]OGC31947.1 MAG: hypothetical protein A2232_06850 [candidate division WOR-1 bacterium RIFOXYA2_FULL_46_56]OGC40162.1 MAG: hypothetical protein A2438_02620 [candidate division WOR-1 bacterium RIFOXYC2_FULL_46_14]